MSRKHFESVATSLGLAWKHADAETDAGFFAAVGAVADAFKEENPRFDFDRFVSWVFEVRDGKRDAMGRKVA